MQTVIIENTDVFRLDSRCNGAAYTMTNKRTGEERFAQFGDDAAAFRAEYDAMEEAHANPASAWYGQPWNSCLAYLFSDCLAAPKWRQRAPRLATN